MPPTDAQRRARDKWLSEKVETINLRVPKGSKEIIKTHAEKHGESTNAFVYRTVMEAIERDEQADSDRGAGSRWRSFRQRHCPDSAVAAVVQLFNEFLFKAFHGLKRDPMNNDRRSEKQFCLSL